MLSKATVCQNTAGLDYWHLSSFDLQRRRRHSLLQWSIHLSGLQNSQPKHPVSCLPASRTQLLSAPFHVAKQSYTLVYYPLPATGATRKQTWGNVLYMHRRGLLQAMWRQVDVSSTAISINPSPRTLTHKTWGQTFTKSQQGLITPPTSHVALRFNRNVLKVVYKRSCHVLRELRVW